MSEYERYIARRGMPTPATPAAPIAPSAPARATPDVNAAFEQLTREEEAKRAWLAKLNAPAAASARLAPAAGLRNEFSQWGSAAQREEEAKRAWLAKASPPK